MYSEHKNYNEAFKCFSEYLYRVGEENIKFKEEIAAVLNNIGNVKYDQGFYKDAVSFFVKSLKLKEVVFGRQSIHSASVAVNLGTSYYQMKQYDQAKEQFQNS